MLLLFFAPLSENIEAVFALIVVVVLLILGLIFSVQNSRRVFFYSILHTRFYRAQITTVTNYSQSVFVRWRHHEDTVWCVYVNWRDRDGEMQEAVIETKNPVLGHCCEESEHIRIAVVCDRKRRSERVRESARTNFLPLRLFKSYFGVRADEPLVEPVPAEEIMFISQWIGHKIYSFFYMLMFVPIVLLILFFIIAFVVVPIVQALGYKDLDAFFDQVFKMKELL